MDSSQKYTRDTHLGEVYSKVLDKENRNGFYNQGYYNNFKYFKDSHSEDKNLPKAFQKQTDAMSKEIVDASRRKSKERSRSYKKKRKEGERNKYSKEKSKNKKKSKNSNFSSRNYNRNTEMASSYKNDPSYVKSSRSKSKRSYKNKFTNNKENKNYGYEDKFFDYNLNKSPQNQAAQTKKKQNLTNDYKRLDESPMRIKNLAGYEYNNYLKPFYKRNKNDKEDRSSMISSRSIDLTAENEKIGNKVFGVSPSPARKSPSGSKIRSQTSKIKKRNGVIEKGQRSSSRKRFGRSPANYERGTAYGQFLPENSPHESYMFKNSQRGRLDTPNSKSPVLLNNLAGKSGISLLNQSNNSKTSKMSNRNSFYTRRGENSRVSQVMGKIGSHFNDLSRTWVKSGLLDSREDISTFSNYFLTRI